MDLHIVVILLSLYGVPTMGVVNDYVPHIYNSHQGCYNNKSSIAVNSILQPAHKWQIMILQPAHNVHQYELYEKEQKTEQNVQRTHYEQEWFQKPCLCSVVSWTTLKLVVPAHFFLMVEEYIEIPQNSAVM